MNKDETAKAKEEVRQKAGKIAQIAIRIFFARLNPLVPLKDFNSLIHLYLKEINPVKGKFVGTTEQVNETLEMMRWNHKKFVNIKQEVDYVLKEFPELSLHGKLVYEYIKSKR